MENIINWLVGKIVKTIVFINYSTKNSGKVRNIETFLKRYHGVRVFKAPTSIETGSESRKNMIDNVRNCDIFIPFISQESVKSAVTQQEIGIAVHLKKDIFPIVLDKVNEEKLGFLKDIQYIKYSDKNLKLNLGNKIYNRYKKVFIFWIIVVVIIIFLGGIS